MQSVNQLSISRQQNYPPPNPPTWKVCDWWQQPFPGMFRPDTVHSLPPSPHSTPTYLSEKSVTGDSSLFQVCWGQAVYAQSVDKLCISRQQDPPPPTYLKGLWLVTAVFSRCAEARHCTHSLLISSASADNRTPLLQPTWKVCDWWQQSFPGVLRPDTVHTVCW